MKNRKAGEPRNAHRRRTAVALVAIGCALAVGACGSSARPHGTGAGGGPLLKLAECMRSHGVPDFPDPRATGGLVIPSNINPDAPVFMSARQQCNRVVPGAAGPGAASSESRKLAFLKLAQCIRRHGLSNFPDPTSHPSPSGGGNALGGGGVFLVVPNPLTPAFKHAASACGFSVPSG
jgi:hypothetical protein